MSAADSYAVVDEGKALLVADRQKANKRRETYWRHVAASIAAYPLKTSLLSAGGDGAQNGPGFSRSSSDVDSDQTASSSSSSSSLSSSGSNSAGLEESGEGQKSKNGNGTTALKKASDVPRGSDGKPLMPLTLFKGLVILSLGTIQTRPRWHTKKYIWPLGFKSVRQYSSMHDPETKIDYTNEIVESPAGAPLFRVSCMDNNSLFYSTNMQM